MRRGSDIGLPSGSVPLPTQSLRRGIYRRERFPDVAVRASLMALQFSVLMSEPELPDGGGFILTHYAGKRRSGHPSFARMFQWFNKEHVAELNRQCDTIKKRL